MRYGTTSYRYDPTGRIEQAAGPGLPSEVFRWDAAANLVSSDHPRGFVEHNRLKMFEDKRFEYDVYGRLVRKLSGHGPAKELVLEYDDWNQLKTVVTKDRLGVGTTHFEYDAFGRRIRKLNGGYASTDFLWDGMRLVQETYHVRQGEEALTYLYEANSYVPLARIDQGKAAANDANVRDAVYYFHNDVSGLPEELTNADGELVWQARYKVWGNAVREEWIARMPQGSIPAWGTVQEATSVAVHIPRPQNLRFQGEYLDRETGLHYNLFRYYDPDIGRFISPDPIGLVGGINLYQYAPNPISWIDPWGLSCGPTKAARPQKVVNDLKDFRSRNFRFGSETFELEKSGMKHILERHHPEYWDGSVKAKQSFFDSKMSIDDVSDAIGSVMKQNSELLEARGTQGMYQIKGTYDGADYVLGLNNGRVGQFYKE
ncbi:RHS repeat domain-containing protein [Burkholderia contaminans]|uniref:RHS repeat domain-containing protein n=1 Tax=Burkholderia contaminans TaxID=488447 RepID=UPI0020C65B1C|nr:RHS repeat-associated core domain-containing protein [Burkholderia contaminans]